MFKKRTKIISINTIISIMAAFFAVFFFTSGPALAQYKTGSPAPDFTLNALDKKPYQLNQFINKQQHLLLCFINSEDDTSIGKLENLVAFFNDYQPQESYQIIAIIEKSDDTETIIERLSNLKEKTDIPLIMLWDEEGEVSAGYGIKNYPTILLLRTDLYVRKAYDRFTARHEASFYQYLNFIFTSHKTKNNNGGCDDGSCKPPPGWE